MTLTHDTGHAAEGLARLCEQYKSNADVQALLNANAVSVQAVEDALWQLQTMRLPLADATGAQLDGLGDIIGQLRQGRSDADYILWLKARLLANASVGEPERLIEIAFLITGAVLHLVQEPPAACVLWIDGALDPDVDPLLLSQILGVAVAGGVNLQMVYALVANADAFTFADADVEQADALRGWAADDAGTERTTNGSFDSWSGGSPVAWTRYNHIAGQQEVNQVGTGAGHGGGGTGSVNLWSSSAWIEVMQSIIPTVIGHCYQVTAVISYDDPAGAGLIAADGILSHVAFERGIGTKTVTLTACDTTMNFALYILGPGNVTIDSVSMIDASGGQLADVEEC